MILGVNAYCYSSGVALYNGQVETSLEEERFSREKRTSAFPQLALADVAGQISLADTELIAHPWDPWRLLRAEAKLILQGLPRSLDLLRPGATSVGSTSFALETLTRFKRDLRRTLNGDVPRVSYVSHHRAHAALSFFGSPYDEAMVIVCDGFGDRTALSVWSARGSRLDLEYESKLPASLGMLYSFVTHHLGFRFGHDEGTVMALAALGNDDLIPEFARIVRPRADGTLGFDYTYLNYHRSAELRPFTSKFVERFGPARKPDEPLAQRHYDLAAALQATLETSLLHVARVFASRLGFGHIALGGGVALNCVTNGRIARELPVDGVYVPPNPDDGGTALGAAMWAHHCTLGKRRGEPIIRADYGSDLPDWEIRTALQGRRAIRVDDPARVAVDLLVDGRVVGWCQGRMEMGPRALGSRSIIADPRDRTMKDRLNRVVKHRQWFRPFAPAVLSDEAEKWFPGCPTSPFMSFASRVHPEKADQVPAVLHVDGTARVQTVDREGGGLFHRLVVEFGRRTGVPMVLNTSLNDREPICRTAAEAVACFDSAELDALMIGDYLLLADGIDTPAAAQAA